jgi:alanine dehydrogenase
MALNRSWKHADGLPKEIKNNDFRVGLTPTGADMLTKGSHKVFLQKGACVWSGIADEEVGARYVLAIKDIFLIFPLQ